MSSTYQLRTTASRDIPGPAELRLFFLIVPFRFRACQNYCPDRPRDRPRDFSHFQVLARFPLHVHLRLSCILVERCSMPLDSTTYYDSYQLNWSQHRFRFSIRKCLTATTQYCLVSFLSMVDGEAKKTFRESKVDTHAPCSVL